jgi:hypothetical protein
VYWDKADAGKSAFLDQAANPPFVQDASQRGALIRSDKSSWNRSEQRQTQLSLKIRNKLHLYGIVGYHVGLRDGRGS